jgi:hypothetical protein
MLTSTENASSLLVVCLRSMRDSDRDGWRRPLASSLIFDVSY